MAIQQRIKKDSPEKADAKARWKAVEQASFNHDDNLFKYHQRFWDKAYPDILARITLSDPALAKRLRGEISWDRKMAGVIFWLEGKPHDPSPWPSKDELVSKRTLFDDKPSAPVAKKPKLKLKRK